MQYFFESVSTFARPFALKSHSMRLGGGAGLYSDLGIQKILEGLRCLLKTRGNPHFTVSAVLSAAVLTAFPVSLAPVPTAWPVFLAAFVVP